LAVCGGLRANKRLSNVRTTCGIGQPQFDREGFAQSLLNKERCPLRRHWRRLVPNRSDRNRPAALTA